ncbi:MULTISPECIES: aldolase [unclassified Methylobacterium]|uniref:aldolase n=2 Tax=Methylobacterium TaxID=407 RepID=UPI0036FCF3D4
MSAAPSRPEPAAPRRALLVADAEAARAALAGGARALVLGGAFPPHLVARLRADRTDLAIYAALDGLDDPALDALVALEPDAVLLRDARSGRDVAALGARLAVCEAEGDRPDGSLSILAAIRHPLGLLGAAGFVGASPRLRGLGLDAPALAALLGEGEALAQARGMIRIAAAAAGVPAFAWLAPERRPHDAATAQWDGFGFVVV